MYQSVTYISDCGPMSGPNEREAEEEICDLEEARDIECSGTVESCTQPRCANAICEKHSFTGEIRGVLYENICFACQAEIERFPMPGVRL